MPAWLLPLLLGGGMAAQGAGSALSARGQSKQAKENSLRDDARDRDLAFLDALLKQQQNPYSGIMSQLASLLSLDEIERSTTKPAKVSFGANAPSFAGQSLQSYIPDISGGYSFDKSPELRSAAGAAKRLITGGQGTNPSVAAAAYGGKGAPAGSPTGGGALDLFALMNGGGASGTMPAGRARDMSFQPGRDGVTPPTFGPAKPGDGGMGTPMGSKNPFAGRSGFLGGAMARGFDRAAEFAKSPVPAPGDAKNPFAGRSGFLGGAMARGFDRARPHVMPRDPNQEGLPLDPTAPPADPTAAPAGGLPTREQRDSLKYLRDQAGFAGASGGDYGGDTKARTSMKNTWAKGVQAFDQTPESFTPEELREFMQSDFVKTYFPGAELVQGGKGDLVDFKGMQSDYESGVPVHRVDVIGNAAPGQGTLSWQDLVNDAGGAPAPAATSAMGGGLSDLLAGGDPSALLGLLPPEMGGAEGDATDDPLRMQRRRRRFGRRAGGALGGVDTGLSFAGV